MDSRIIFITLLGSAALLAWRWGGQPERWTAAIFIAAYVASLLVVEPLARRYDHVEVAVLCVDLCLLAGMIAVALSADRYWPMVDAAILIVSISAHGAKMVDPKLFRLAYQIGLVPWSYVAVATLLAGTIRHHRRVQGKPNWPSWLESSRPIVQMPAR